MSVLKIKDGNNWVDIPAIKGADGTNGTNGVDGFSPTATVSKSGTTTTISITDKNGTTTATINDGTNGTNGTNGQDGRDGYVQYTAGDNITIDNNVISATGGGSDVDIVTRKTYSQNQPIIFSTLKKGYYDLFDSPETSLYYKVQNTDTVQTIFNMYATYLDIYISKTIDEAIAEMQEYSSLNSTTIGIIHYIANNGKYSILSISYNRNGTILTSAYSKDLIVLNTRGQTISGVKTFDSIPKVSSYTAPTENAQLVAKKYVDDKIGDINTILATLTTPSGGE